MSMDRALLSDEAFRAAFRAWLSANVDASLRRPMDRLRGQEMRDWLRRLQEGGWRAPGWPRAAGGMGLSIAKQNIYQEELEAAGVARLLDVGGTMLAPALLAHGTEAQRQHYLPRILDGTDIWCQGYSEPGAGSDLASLRTTARREGDTFVIDGQKIWTTHASDADAIFVLARTSSDGPKQTGITFLLVDIHTPGITIRPIVNLAGEDEFCEVFFDGVRVPDANVVGQVDKGWTVAKALLSSERITVATPLLPRLMIRYIEKVAATLGVEGTSGYRAGIGELLLDLADLSALHVEVSARAFSDQSVDHDLSTMKILNADLTQRCAAFLLHTAGDHAIDGRLAINGEVVDISLFFMLAIPTSIFGGTSEIQRNILAKSALGLPSA